MMQALVEAGVLVEITVLLGVQGLEAALMRQAMMTKTIMGITNSTPPPTIAPTPTATLLRESVNRK